MRKALLAMLVLVTPALLAQEVPPKQKPPEQPTEEQPKPQPAPQLGHPLDPADVDVLTGKNKVAPAGPRAQVNPYGYGGYSGYPLNAANWNARRNSQTSAPFFPLGFGRFNRQNFFLFRNTIPFGRSFFFFSNRGGAGNFLLFSPAGGGSLLRRR